MNPILLNFYHLYSDDDRIVVEALQEKRSWLLRKFYLPGHFQPTFDRYNEKHYPSLERLLDQVLHFKPIRMNQLQCLKTDEKLLFENALTHLKMVTLYDRPVDEKKHPFWIEYDFSKVERPVFQELAANIFPAVHQESLAESYPSSALAHMLKYAFVDEIGRYKLILDQQVLLDDCYYLPIASKIIYDEHLDPILKEVLLSIATRLNLESETY